MLFSQKALLTDVEGKPIPQYYDPKSDEFKPMTKEVEIAGNKLVQQFTEADVKDGKLTFSKNIQYIGIYNRHTADGVFKVNGFNITIPAGETAEFAVGGTPSNEITVTGSTKFIISRYE